MVFKQQTFSALSLLLSGSGYRIVLKLKQILLIVLKPVSNIIFNLYKSVLSNLEKMLNRAVLFFYK